MNAKYDKKKTKHKTHLWMWWNMQIRNKSHDEIPKYENILSGTVKEQLEVVRIFEEKLKILEKL